MPTAIFLPVQGSQLTFTVLPQGYFNSPVYWYNLVRRDLDFMQVLRIIIHCIDIMIISENKDEGRTDLNAMETHTTNKGF